MNITVEMNCPDPNKANEPTVSRERFELRVGADHKISFLLWWPRHISEELRQANSARLIPTLARDAIAILEQVGDRIESLKSSDLKAQVGPMSKQYSARRWTRSRVHRAPLDAVLKALGTSAGTSKRCPGTAPAK